MYVLFLLVALMWSLAWSDTAQADGCRVLSTDPTYTAGQLKDLTCDVNGKLVTGGSGGAVRSTVMATGVTTNTTSAAVALPIGSKTISGRIAGTGAITQTQAIYGSTDNAFDATIDVLLCTLTLSGTTTNGDACPQITENFAHYFVVTTATTGTATSGIITAAY